MNPDTNMFETLRIGPDATRGDAKGIADGLRQLLRPDGTPVPPHWTVLTVGEHVQVKGYTFKVGYINETTLVLEPVKIPILGTHPAPEEK